MALALYGAAIQIGIVMGLVSTGYAIQNFGLTTTYFAGAVLTLVAIGLLFAIQSSKKRPATQPDFATA